MSDITGDAITVYAAEEITKAIESMGTTKAKQQVGKAMVIKNETGVKLSAADEEAKFVGVVKAASGEARATFASARMVNDGSVYNGSNPTLAPYYEGNVDIPAGKAMTIERNCITNVLLDDSASTAKAGDLITVAADGKFTTTTTFAKAVGRLYDNPSSLNVARAYIRAI